MRFQNAEEVNSVIKEGDYIYVYNYDGMKDCKHIGQVVSFRDSCIGIRVTLKGVIKLSSNKLIYKESDDIEIWHMRQITQVEYMALLDCYKRHEKMRATIKAELSKFHKLAKDNH